MRRTTIALEVTDRDRQILMCIGVHRYMAVAQLATQFFSSQDYCRRRVRVLFDAGLVAVTLAGSNKSNVVSLTPDGVREVAQVDPDLAATLRLPGTLRAAGLAHHLAIVDCRLYLAALAEAGGPPLIRWLNAEPVVVGRGTRHPKLLPDGLAELAIGGGVLRLAVEYDAGTESLDVLRRKAARYEQAVGAGDIDEIWFVVAHDGGRLHNIAALAAEAGIGPVTRVMPLAHVVARPVRQPLARVGGQGLVGDQSTVAAHRQNPTHVHSVAGCIDVADRMAGRTPAGRGR